MRQKVAFLVIAFAASIVQAQETAEPNVKIGETAPAFTLKNQDGKDVSLRSLREESQYIALVFIRSADW